MKVSSVQQRDQNHPRGMPVRPPEAAMGKNKGGSV